MEELVELAKNPVAAGMLAIAVLALAVYKLSSWAIRRNGTGTHDTSHLEGKLNQLRREVLARASADEARWNRFESHAKRVHELSGLISSLPFLANRVDTLEKSQGGQDLELKEMRIRTERIETTVNNTEKSVDNMRDEMRRSFDSVWDRINSELSSLRDLIMRRQM